ncbi:MULTISPECIES: phage portal protein [Actinomycetes]|uniref:phage portal protein n=1 Tax=Actinomycetes TaxID=1760 RepID=UPI00342864B1
MTWSTDDIRSLSISGLSDEVLGEVRGLLRIWDSHRTKNLKRNLYFDTEQAFKDLGIAMPPQLRKCNYVLGWATQAVRKPALRSQFDGLRLAGVDDPFELGEILDANSFDLEFSQSVVSAYKHGMSLVTVAKGGLGEAPVQIIGHSAEACAARWDKRTRRLASALTIADVDEDGRPVEFVVYLPNEVITCSFIRGSGWSSFSQSNRTGRVLAVPVLNDPQLNRPLGRSRLTNAVMRLNDMAVRTLGRMEGNAEFYSSPQIALLGVDYESFYGDNAMSESEKFKLAMDRLLAISKDEDGDKPDLKQLQQATMTPHSDMMRTIAMAFSGETSLPPSSLGVIHDQPASAEAIRAAEHDLLIDASYHNNSVHPKSVKQIMELAVMVRDNATVVPDDMWRLSVRFIDPEFRSLSAEADAVTKIGAAMPSLVDQPVLLERIFTADEVERIRVDGQKASVASLVDRIANAQAVPQNVADAQQAGSNNQEA